MDPLKQLIEEPGALTPRQYARRARQLAALHLALAFGAVTGEGVLFARGKVLVTLAQRSNVETLTLAFFAVFFAYVGLLGLRGAPGALRVVRFALLARIRGREAAERAKHEALGLPRGDGPIAALSVVLERQDSPARPFELAVQDAAGSMGRLRVDGARVQHAPHRRDGSANLLAYFARQVDQVAGRRQGRDVDVVEWGTLDDEATRRFLALAEFGRNLGAALGRDGLWPRVVLTAEDCAELERRLAAICPALRDEGFLPHWEYEAEHKLPIVPEPLGLASLGRTEKRADPLPSLTALALVVALATALLAALILYPPWVPGK
ncbi:hypothetical protein [Anaeromyxobacter terrae]|uniref:hypothetical protein n=1 Tax=Anaeromyxobacter terrae TaxID=2925406 RepID=UPI001F58A915|nr:hypothetical protein [Anaeromyxobacter sp. SG22]